MEADQRRRRALLLIVGALSGLAPMSIDFYLPALPHLTADLGADTSTGQLTLTACLLGIALSQVVAGSLSDTLGRRRLVLIGLAAYGSVSVLCAVAPSIWVLLGLRFAQGAACGVGFVVSRAIVRDVYSGDAAARIFALLVLVSGVAPVLAPALGGQVLLLTSWRGIFVVLAVLGAVLFATAALRLPETLPADLRHEPGLGAKLRVFGALLTDRRFVPFAVSGGLSFAAMFAYISGSPFVLENIYGVSPQLYGLAFGLNSAGIVAASQVSRQMVGRVGPGPLLRVGVTTMAVGGAALLATVLLGLGLVPLLICLLATISSVGLIQPNATALAMAHQRHAAGSASALFGLGQFGVGAAAAPLVGIAGADSAVPMAVVIAVCGIASLLVLRGFAVGPATKPREAGV
ncbi:MAG TPA: multidrug effflux MFS transporter [Solirubrobacterales bacterium]|nr:multidrug effflux MFS transporter [Solirubrobacterales bacterium]